MLFSPKVKVFQKYIRIGMFITLLQSLQKDITAENSHEGFPGADILGLVLAGPHLHSFITQSTWYLRRLQDFHPRDRTAL